MAYSTSTVIEDTFKMYTGSLPNKSTTNDPQLKYHPLAGAFFWSDEGLIEAPSALSHAFRPVINYRTYLLCQEGSKKNEKIYLLAKQYFQDWIGFSKNRCTYDPYLADRLKRIRKVRDWQLNKWIE